MINIQPGRRSLRLVDYDYTSPGSYFITICLQNAICVLSEINIGQLKLNDIGLMVEHWWRELSNKYSVIELDQFIIMPNHVHGIISINDPRVGAALRGRPNKQADENCGRPRGVAPTLGEMICWFKTMTTNEYIHAVESKGWPPFYGRLWQRNYYERIIRNEIELEQIRTYIAENPSRWATDNENHANVVKDARELNGYVNYFC